MVKLVREEFAEFARFAIDLGLYRAMRIFTGMFESF